MLIIIKQKYHSDQTPKQTHQKQIGVSLPIKTGFAKGTDIKYNPTESVFTTTSAKNGGLNHPKSPICLCHHKVSRRNNNMYSNYLNFRLSIGPIKYSTKQYVMFHDVDDYHGVKP